MGNFTAVIGVVGATLIIFYPLNDKMIINIENDLTLKQQRHLCAGR
ncbi:MAG: hypothetical protein P8X73_11755 [Ignavibacteriaceae bacterium]